MNLMNKAQAIIDDFKCDPVAHTDKVLMERYQVSRQYILRVIKAHFGVTPHVLRVIFELGSKEVTLAPGGKLRELFFK